MILEKELELTDDILQEEVVIKKATKKKKAVKEAIVENKEEIKEDDLESNIDVWKAQYKKIFKNEIDGEVIIWRRLKRGEYKEILKADTDEDDKILVKQELMVKAAVLYPYDVETLIDDNAGLATVLSEEILAKSGFAISYTEEI